MEKVLQRHQNGRCCSCKAMYVFAAHVGYQSSNDLISLLGGGGAYLFLDTSEGPYWREGIFTKSSDEDVNDSFAILLPHVLLI